MLNNLLTDRKFEHEKEANIIILYYNTRSLTVRFLIKSLFDSHFLDLIRSFHKHYLHICDRKKKRKKKNFH